MPDDLNAPEMLAFQPAYDCACARLTCAACGGWTAAGQMVWARDEGAAAERARIVRLLRDEMGFQRAGHHAARAAIALIERSQHTIEEPEA